MFSQNDQGTLSKQIKQAQSSLKNLEKEIETCKKENNQESQEKEESVVNEVIYEHYRF